MLNPAALLPVGGDGDFVRRPSNTLCRHPAAKAGRRDLLPSVPACHERRV